MKLSEKIRLFMDCLADHAELLEQRLEFALLVTKGNIDDDAIIGEVERLCHLEEFGAAVELANKMQSKLKLAGVLKVIKECESL